MDLRATIPLSEVLGYLAVRGAVAILSRELGLTVSVGWPDFIVILGSTALIMMLFVVVVAPYVYQRHLDRATRTREASAARNDDSRAALDFLRRAAVSLFLVAVIGVGIWLRFVIAATGAVTASDSLPSTLVYYTGLVLIGTAFAGVLIVWTLRLPELPKPEQRYMHHNGDLTEGAALALVGREGAVQAALRPQGNLKLDGRTYVVKSEGPFIEAGTPVRVDRIEGQNIVVTPLEEMVLWH
jgi:membrane protein implicated in regulation of membrane protease activity